MLGALLRITLASLGGPATLGAVTFMEISKAGLRTAGGEDAEDAMKVVEGVVRGGNVVRGIEERASDEG